MSAKPTPVNKTAFRLIASLGILAVLGASLWLYLRSTAPFKIAVTFAGFTNNAATFVVANHGSCRAFQMGECDYQIQGDSGLRWGGGGIQELMLAPGQSNIIVVPALTAREAPWRVALSFSGDDWRLKLAMKPPWVQDMVKGLLPLKQKTYMLRLEEAFSEWLGPEGVTTARRRTWSPPELYTNPPSSLWESPFLKRSLTQTNLNW